MPKNSLNVSLKGADDIFSTEESRQEQQREQVQQIPIGELFPFKHHPFKVLDDESMQRTVESVEQYGVLSPLIARPRPEGGYEIISGHRRQHAAQLAGLETLPVIVRQMDDDAAVLLMVDSNLQRENILPSERAFAYKMKLEAIERTVGRPKNVGQVVPHYFGKRSTEVVAEGTGESYKQIQRFIRLTSLIPELLNMVDEKKIAFNPAVELSYLDESQQRDFLEAMNDTQNAPSLSQAQRLKKLAQEGHFSYDVAFAVMGEEKKDELDKVVIKNDTLRKYFPRSYTPKQMEDTIIKLLEQWQRKQQRRMNADLYRNERPDGVFFFCKQKEKTPMKNNVTRTIRSEEITIDVRICAALAANRGGEVYLAAIAPDMELTVITLDEAPGILPCFEEDDACLNLPDTSLLLCYNPAQVLKMGGKHYLTGPVILVRTNMDGEVISLTIDEVYLFQKYLASHSITLMADDQKLPCICME